ncbi:glycosyltransferase [Clostridium sp. D53t1_180928_C8]|uniref:glycosyltransferase n=1 Tax=Clostridium sp. D53t1_180928_C8 TaxID=2787101 RepID=UPI0018A8DD57|nr:glycosyltransferase [Clostridium sp. D53t1_180928_C8]
MKKDILFIIPGLGAGGGEKSLINLLSQIDFDKYNVDLFLLKQDGLFMNFIPKEVNILTMPKDIVIFNEGLTKSIFKYLSKGKFKLAYSRLMFCIKNRGNYNIGKAEQYSWKYLRNAIGYLNKEYDIAIGYLEKTSNYICVDCVQAKKKILWIHNDYRKLNLDKEFDLSYFKKANYLVTVSEECESVLREEFPNQEEKVKLIYNIVSKKSIENLANEALESSKSPNNKINILSIGRLHEQKGFDMAIEACNDLINKGYDICWNVIGAGIEKNKLEEAIQKNNLTGVFNLLGLRNNPYKYLKNCDIYAQPSRYEGKSVAIDEAKILCKPILVTNFSTVYDQIEDYKTGIITEMNFKDISLGLENLINNEKLRKELIKNLSLLHLGNEDEILKFYELIKE